jgi:pSer/pThr/pTyr-binding forkhead associated (FHA) protein
MPHWSDPLSAAPTSFRIRVGNEEIALPLGVTLIGRDGSCRISIFDSLISRQHARIQCDGEHAAVEDLGSLNGTRVNGVVISGPHALRDGDRIGIGSYELAVAVVDPQELDALNMPTGVQSVCPDCRMVYAAGARSCPRCGSTRVAPQPAQKRAAGLPGGRWSLDLIVEMLGRSILTGSASEAEKLMRQAAFSVSERLQTAKPISPEELRTLDEAARWLDKVQKGDSWSEWMGKVRGQMRGTVRPPPDKP